MKLPRWVYVIVVYDRITGCIPDGIYVGSSADVKKRIAEHLHDYSSNSQKEFHELMRKRRFQVWILDSITSMRESHLEYDWIQFFQEKTAFPIFNVRTNQCGADWHRLEGKEEYNKWSQYVIS